MQPHFSKAPFELGPLFGGTFAAWTNNSGHMAVTSLCHPRSWMASEACLDHLWNGVCSSDHRIRPQLHFRHLWLAAGGRSRHPLRIADEWR